MATNNHTVVLEFFLQCFSENLQFQGISLVLFFLLYLMALTGNCLIVMAICLNPALHAQTYFFLTNLAIVDIIGTSTVLPKLLENLVGKGCIISYGCCMTQLFFISWVLGTELLLITVMAYDHYVAICQPLQYHTLVSKHFCALLASIMWLFGGISSVHTGLMAELTFCGSNQIHIFLCEIPTLLMFTCGPTYLNNIMVVITDVYFGVLNFLLTMAFYAFIIASILHICSVEGKCQAFSTCSSHLLVACMYYSTIIYTYMLPGFGSSVKNGKVVAILYTALSLTVNPLIYTLQNKDVNAALRNVFPCLESERKRPM